MSRHESSSLGIPQPMDGLHEMGPPPFLTKTYDIVEDSSTNGIVSWSRGNNSFVVWDPQAFSMSLLPRYFKHSNFSSFVRQLNTYGFRKVHPDRWEFANEGFLRGQRQLLKNIRRRKAPNQPHPSQQQPLDPCVELGRFGVDGEVDRLRRDKQVLMIELIKLRQQQQNARTCLQLMEQRLKKTENKQHQTMNFLARAMKNPNFVHQLVHQNKGMMKELEEEINRKRRRPIDQGPKFELGDGGVELDGLVKIEPQELEDLNEFDLEELGKLAMNMEELSERQLQHEIVEEGDVMKHQDDRGKDIVADEGFWENLLNDDVAQQMGMLGDEEGVEDVDVLVEQLGHLGSSSNHPN